jgi:glucose/arabinose dehydrogenase
VSLPQWAATVAVSAALAACAGSMDKLGRGASDSVSADPADRVAIRISSAIGWNANQKPAAPPGFTVSRYAAELRNPRWITVAPNGDVLVAESSKPLPAGIGGLFARLSRHVKSQGLDRSADRITLLRDADGDGQPELRSVLLENLHSPMGMLVQDGWLYVANTDAVLRFPYQTGQTRIDQQGERVLRLPEDGYDSHWTRNIVASADGKRLYVSVGSASNDAMRGLEDGQRRACILSIDPDGRNERVHASGLRNPLAMAIEPARQSLWTAVAEREGRGDERVPDFFTQVREGGFYGWPWAYFGPHPDTKLKDRNPAQVTRSITPDVDLGAHVSPLGLVFYEGASFAASYRGGAFIAEHGSWNHSRLVGYKVVFIPFSGGLPSAAPRDFLTGFIADTDASEVHGRPVGLAVAKDGALLVADDAGNSIWRVQSRSQSRATPP